MGTQFDGFTEDHLSFIPKQHIFFTASAGPEGKVNLSPKGMDALRVFTPNRLAYVNATGSGNETAGHLLQNPRLTVMWCSYDKDPMILRAYGTARAVHPRDAAYADLAAQLPQVTGARQIIDMQIGMVQSSCGYAVPYMDFTGERPILNRWATAKGSEGVAKYWEDRNQTTLDGLPTGVLHDTD